MLRHSFASHCVMAGYHLREVQVWMGHSTILVTERYAHLAPKKGSTDKLSDARLVQFYGTRPAPRPPNVGHLADFQGKNDSGARPELGSGRACQTRGAHR